jgi:hypothetical protein
LGDLIGLEASIRITSCTRGKIYGRENVFGVLVFGWFFVLFISRRYF